MTTDELQAEVARETARALEAERQCGEHARIGDGYWERAHAAEARVAELERYVEQLKVRVATGNRLRQESDAALSSVRALLTELYEVTPLIPSASWGERYTVWLRAHPATATPAATGAESWPMHMDCPSCGKEHVDELDPATGIDWSVRPHKTHLCLGCGHKWKPSAFPTVGVARAEKEQGT